jgi:hypothetical protein
MAAGRRMLTVVSLSALAGVVAVTAGHAARHPTHAGLVKPVIGAPTMVPTKPSAGKRFTVSFKITRSDSGARLTTGRLTASSTVGGKTIAHTASFKRGVARVSLVIPAGDAGKLLRVKVKLASGGTWATRLATYRVPAVVKPSISIDDAGIIEGDRGNVTLLFPVTLSAATTGAVAVDYATADGTATAPSDYTAAAGTLRFAPGEKSKTIEITIVGDLVLEPDETFTVALSNAQGGTISRATATGTIWNTDHPAQPGHYEGKTSQNERFAFDVTSDAMGVTDLVTGQINQSCTHYNISQGQLDFGSYRISIDADGTFKFDQTFKNTVNGETTVETNDHIVITGRFAENGASGTLLRTLDFDACSSGPQTWTATRTG